MTWNTTLIKATMRNVVSDILFTYEILFEILEEKERKGKSVLNRKYYRFKVYIVVRIKN